MMSDSQRSSVTPIAVGNQIWLEPFSDPPTTRPTFSCLGVTVREFALNGQRVKLRNIR